MPTAVVTGMNGTLAPEFAHLLEANGYQVFAWNRQHMDTDNLAACLTYINSYQPDIICHFATGSVLWAEHLAKISASKQIPMLFTSTAMVFNAESSGPFSVKCETSALDEYGQNKKLSEQLVLQHNPHALICRLGWQIDWDVCGNNMYFALEQMTQGNKAIKANINWIPACSFMSDTCHIMWQLIADKASGIYHIDGNAKAQLSFYEIVKRIRNRRGKGWMLLPEDGPKNDQRLIEARIQIPCISKQL